MTDLTLICETCQFPITGDKGSIYVRMGDIRDARRAEREWRDLHPEDTALDLATLLMMPDDIHWRTGHDACRDDRDEGCYEIDSVRIASWQQLAWWTAHLMEKNWLPMTDWDDLLREVAGDIPSRRIRVVAEEAA